MKQYNSIIIDDVEYAPKEEQRQDGLACGYGYGAGFGFGH